MSLRPSSVLVLAFIAATGSAITLVMDGCGSDTNTGSSSGAPADAATGADGTSDGPAESDAGSDAARVDAACPKGKTVAATGETCTGFGKGDPCDPACGLPLYGYVCVNGGPPGFTGCIQASATSLGDTYCCPKNDCVPQPDQDTMCKIAGKTHRYQCPPDETGKPVAPPAGCTDGGAGGSAVETYYCCP